MSLPLTCHLLPPLFNELQTPRPMPNPLPHQPKKKQVDWPLQWKVLSFSFHLLNYLME